MSDVHPKLPASEGWKPAATAPETAEWVQLAYMPQHHIKPVIIIAHWACDLSGEEQPPFKGWFQHNLGDGGRSYGFRYVPDGWIAWRPVWPATPTAAGDCPRADVERLRGALLQIANETWPARNPNASMHERFRDVLDQIKRFAHAAAQEPSS